LNGVQDVLQLRQQMPFIVTNINSTYMLIASTGNGNIPGRLLDMTQTFMDVVKVHEAEYNET